MVDLLLMAIHIITTNSLGGPEGGSVGGNACYTNLASLELLQAQEVRTDPTELSSDLRMLTTVTLLLITVKLKE